MTSIRAIACALPDRKVTNADLAAQHPAWDIEAVAEISGVESRRLVAEDETAFDLSVRACEALLARPGVDPDAIGAILYCTHDPDYQMPGNAQLLHRHLGLGDGVATFDYRLACSGFVYGLAIADAFARSGLASSLLLVTAETPSKRTNPRDRSTRSLLGDGAAVTYLSADGGGAGVATVVACELCTHGAGFWHAYIPAGGARVPSSMETRRESADRSGNIRTAEDLHMEGTDLWAFVSSIVPGHIEEFLASQSLTLDQIDLCVFHQASALILRSLTKALSLPPEKMFIHLRDTGNLSSASIPFALQAALDQGAIRPGDLVLLCGFGVGISYGSAIVQF